MIHSRLSRKRYLLTLIISIAIILQTAVFFVADSQRGREIEINKRVAAQELGVLRARLEGQLNANLIAMRGLRAEIMINPDIDPQRFNRLARELLGTDLQIRHLALAPDLVVQLVYPLAGNEDAIGFDYRSSPAQLATVQRAIAARDIVLAGPLELVQGGSALIARLPVFRSNQPDAALWGIIAEVINTDALLESAGFKSQLGEFNFALRGVNGEGMQGELIAGHAPVWEQEFLAVRVNVPDGHWMLAAYPSAGDWQADASGYWARMIIGTAVVVLITAILTLLLFTQLRLRSALTTISHQARFDPLTDLPNRHYFVIQLERLIQSALRHDYKFAILFIDLDHFKEVNDSLGHDVGDQLLQHIASRIRLSIRPEDLVARMGGDEFVVVLRNVSDAVQAEQQANRIVKSIQPSLRLQQSELSISASIGVAMFPIDGMQSTELLKHADLAMYAAKAAGRQTVYFFDKSLRYAAEQHISLHHDMLTGVENGEFEVFYQPVIDAASGKMTKCEALLRWQHPRHGAIPPTQFIPVAEKTGAIRVLGEFVQTQVCRDWQRLQAAGYDVIISMNRSPREFNLVDSADQWLAGLAAEQMPPTKLMIEITESMLMQSQERQLVNLEKLRAAGVLIAIDDFGTGYSSLNYLRRYPVDFIKIDRSFLLEVPVNKQQNALLGALIRIAQTLKLNIIAEGVENEEQVTLLKQLQCNYLQGFLFSKPAPFAELLSFLKQHQTDTVKE